MPALAFVTPLAGATVQNIWKPPVGVTPGAAGDATAPFALGTLGFITPAAANARVLAQFVRCAGVIAIGGTATIANGVATAGAGTWNNDTGVATVLGDYLFVTAGVTAALAEGAGIVPGADSTRVWRLAKPDDEPAYPLDLEAVLPSGSLGKFTKISGDVEPGAKVGDWTNDTGVKLVDGDYAWLTKAPPEAAQLPAAPPKRGAKAGETDEERKLRETEEAEYQKAERERGRKTHS